MARKKCTDEYPNVNLEESICSRILFKKVLSECSNLDSVYEDYLIHLVGVLGFACLKDAGFLETCGVVNGRQLYTLVNK